MSQLCISADESSQDRLFWNPPQPCDLCHQLQSLFGLAWTWWAAKRSPAHAECQGFSFCSAGCLTFEQCSVMTEILSLRAKIYTSNETVKTVATSLCGECRGSKLLITQEIIFLHSFRFLQMSPCSNQRTWELSSSSRESTGEESRL